MMNSSQAVKTEQRAEVSSVNSGVSSDYHSAFVTPGPGGIRDDERSGTNTPTSFHTPNNPEDSDYQEDIDNDVELALGVSPPDQMRGSFYSDGRPRPQGAEESDEESRHSNDEAGYVTASQPSARCQHFVDPYQPKLLLAEDSIKPNAEKQPLNNEFEPPGVDRTRMTSPDDHEELHREHHHTRRRRRAKEHGRQQETTPLLRDQHRDDQEDTSCCVLL